MIIGAAVGFAIAAVLLVAHKQHRAAEEYGHHRADYCAGLVATPEQKKACEEEAKNARDYLPWGYELISWPDGITAWAIIFTGFFIASQSYETRRAANASAENVRIAEISYQVTRNKEKPRFSISLDSYQINPANPTVDYSVTVRCPTPAYIKSARAAISPQIVNSIAIPRILDIVPLPSVIEESIVLAFEISVGGEADYSSFSQGAYDRLVAREVELVFFIRILFDDVYGEREFSSSQIVKATALNGPDKRPLFMLMDGHARFQVDK